MYRKARGVEVCPFLLITQVNREVESKFPTVFVILLEDFPCALLSPHSQYQVTIAAANLDVN